MAIDFAGTSGRTCNFGSSASIDNLQTWTALYWIYIDTPAVYGTLLQKRDAANIGQALIEINASNFVRAAVRRSAVNDELSLRTINLVEETWTFVAVTYDFNAVSGSRFNLYSGNRTSAAVIKGTAGSGSGTMKDDSSASLWIGSNYDDTSQINGKIAHFSYWNTVLTLGQIVEQQFKPHVTPGCVIFAPLYDAATIPDLSGNGNNGTVTNGVVSDHVPLGPIFSYDRYAEITPLVGNTTIYPNGIGSSAAFGVPTISKEIAYSLDFATYYGGVDNDQQVRAIDTDSSGNIYVAGGGFPLTFPYDTRYFGSNPPGYSHGTIVDSDCCIVKFTPSGSKIWAVQIGGGYHDRIYGIQVGNDGYLYFTGRGGPGFPTTAGVFQPNYSGSTFTIYGDQNAIAGRVSMSTGALSWASYVGTGWSCRSLVLDANNNLIVPLTYGGSGSLPPASWFTNGYKSTPSGGSEQGLIKIDSSGTYVHWATWIGGSGNEDTPSSVGWSAYDNSVWIGLDTFSSDIPTTPGSSQPVRPNPTSNACGYIARFSDPDVTGVKQVLLAASFYGPTSNYGARISETKTLVVGATGHAYTKNNISSATGAPAASAGAFQTSKLTPDGTNSQTIIKWNTDCSINLLTWVDASGTTILDGINVDSDNNVYFCGDTTASDYPVTSDAYQSVKALGNDGVVTKLAADFKTLLYSTYYGGSPNEVVRTMALDDDLNIIVGGSANGVGFPVFNAYQPAFAGGLLDWILIKFLHSTIPSPSPSSSPSASASSSASSSPSPSASESASPSVSPSVSPSTSISASPSPSSSPSPEYECYTTITDTSSVLSEYYINVYDTTGRKVGIFTSWKSLSINRNKGEVPQYEISFLVDASRTNRFFSDMFLVDYQIELVRQLPGAGIGWYSEFTGFHRDSVFETDENGAQYFTTVGVGLTDLLSRTTVAYHAGTVYSDKSTVAETAMKQYVEENCGASAIVANTRHANGVLPGFLVDTDKGNGIVWEGSQSFVNLFDTLVDISDFSGIDFDVISGVTKAEFIFKTYPGQIGKDRTVTNVNSVTGKNQYGNVPVVFSVSRGNVETMSYEINRSGESNIVYVLGNGDGATRDIVVRTNPDAIDDSPWNRREVSRPAGSQEFTYQLEDFGDSVLVELAKNEVYDVSAFQQVGFLYGSDYNYGDRVTVQYSNIAQANKRITGVRISIEENRETVELTMSDY